MNSLENLTQEVTQLAVKQTRYSLGQQINEGGTGAVFLAQDTELGRDVAIKRLKHNSNDTATLFPDTLRREARVLASLNHPNIVTIHDVYRDEGEICVVMELLNGETMNEVAQRSSLDLEDLAELVQQSQDALLAAHENDIVHGDLKPENIMRIHSGNGRPQYKLLDFEQARLTDLSQRTDQILLSTYGSPHFMAPERFEGTPPTRAADIYAMGCVYYHALTGTLPFQGSTPVEVMYSHLNHIVTPLCELRPDLPAWVGQWIDWQLTRNPSDRPRSSLAVSESFRELKQQFNTEAA
ncbi:hypothetical protein NT6N_30080 [Oceaniferula spumae]|uniref:Protein kinase domain-containing protein n=1 Tax=Oceaniferula spumae TaxID=2979115 RepID=A0AAT9FPR7_9BACT